MLTSLKCILPLISFLRDDKSCLEANLSEPVNFTLLKSQSFQYNIHVMNLYFQPSIDFPAHVTIVRSNGKSSLWPSFCVDKEPNLELQLVSHQKMISVDWKLKLNFLIYTVQCQTVHITVRTLHYIKQRMIKSLCLHFYLPN